MWCVILTTVDSACRRARSLGQVYKASLGARGAGAGGDADAPVEVAVKVQRPKVTELIALDLHLLRVGGGLVTALLRSEVCVCVVCRV